MDLSVISRPAWSTECGPGQPGLHRATLSQTNKQVCLHICKCVSTHMYVQHISAWYSKPEEGGDSLRAGVQTVVSHHASAGNEARVLCKKCS